MKPSRLVCSFAVLSFFLLIFGKSFAGQTILEIASDYATDSEQHIYIAPNINQDKLLNFLNKINDKFGTRISSNEVIVYFDETLFGKGDQGVALTNENFVSNIWLGMQGVYDLNSFDSVIVGGFINKEIKIKTKSHQKLSVELTQGNEGAEILGKILQKYLDK